jgi:hypothetical protein
MTGTASECQNCFPPKDEVLINENLMFFILYFLSYYRYLHPKGEVKSLRETHCWEGLRSTVGGNDDRGSLKEKSRRRQRKPRPVNS